MKRMEEQKRGYTTGVFQVGILVSDIDECIRLFCDTLGMEVVFDARNQIPPRGCPAWKTN